MPIAQTIALAEKLAARTRWLAAAAIALSAFACHRTGVAATLEPGGTGSSAQIFVRDLYWLEPDKLPEAVDRAACGPVESGAGTRLDAINFGPPRQMRFVFESVRERLEGGAAK